MAGEKIMVIDDEKIIRDVFVTVFDEYKIIPAVDAQQALNILNRSNDIDLIVLDMMMPGLRGAELLKEIKKINPNYKVIVLTGYNSQEKAIKAVRSDIDAYVEKPFDIENIKQVFKKLLSKPR
jgi:DNA-binding NtrC family response regulator